MAGLATTRGACKGRVRVLHVVGRLARGGIETWLTQVLPRVDRDRFSFDFVVNNKKPGDYDDLVRDWGAEIHTCLSPRRPWEYARNFRRILRQAGPYDIVHSHPAHFSGLPLRIAHLEAVPVRIAHSHNDTRPQEVHAAPPRRAALRLLRSWIIRHATHGLACSQEAGASLFGATWGIDPRWHLHYYGIDLSPFRRTVDPAAVRAELGLPSRGLVVGHIGRFMAQKNHEFLLSIFAELARCVPHAHLLLVGEGPLRPAIEQQAAALGLRECVTFTGLRDDVPRLLQGAIDVMVMPSLHEGLPMVLLEAQAAACPCVFADIISRESVVIPGLMRPVPLSARLGVWVETILQAASEHSLSREQALDALESSPFNIQVSAERLQQRYLEFLGYSER